MENIFDFDLTAEELDYLAPDMTREEYEQGLTLDGAYTGLVMLFAMRKNTVLKEKYKALISDRDFVRFDLGYSDLRPSKAVENFSSPKNNLLKAA